MDYKYFKPVEKEEHMLFASEIAHIYGIYYAGTGVHSRIIKPLIEDYTRDNNIKLEELYYETKNGLTRVYSKEVYHPALMRLLNKYNKIPSLELRKSVLQYESKEGKIYNFKIRECL